jgi:hypothetical protein
MAGFLGCGENAKVFFATVNADLGAELSRLLMEAHPFKVGGVVTSLTYVLIVLCMRSQPQILDAVV